MLCASDFCFHFFLIKLEDVKAYIKGHLETDIVIRRLELEEQNQIRTRDNIVLQLLR